MLRMPLRMLLLVLALVATWVGAEPSARHREVATDRATSLAQPHHHLDDGSVAVDRSSDSLTHFALDHLTPTLAVCSVRPWRCEVGGDAVPSLLARAPVDPLLPSLRRPPRPA